MRARSIAILGAALALVGAAAVGLVIALRESAPRRSPRSAPAPVVTSRPDDGARPVDTAAEPSGSSRIDRDHADELRRLLHAMFADAGAAAEDTAETFEEMPDGVPGNNTHAPLGQYIRERIGRDFLPLAESCYKNLLAKNPRAAGKATVSFKIVGDRRIGGVVDSAKLAPGGDLDDPELALCLRESMMSLSFDAPPGTRSEVTVDYTFDFSPD